MSALAACDMLLGAQVATGANLVQGQRISHPKGGCETSRFGHSLALGDLDGDGRDDLVVAARGFCQPDDGVFIFYSTEIGPFPEPTHFDVWWPGVGVADVNNDGFKDVIVTGGPSLYVFHGGPVRLPTQITVAEASWRKTFLPGIGLSGSVARLDANLERTSNAAGHELVRSHARRVGPRFAVDVRPTSVCGFSGTDAG